MGNTVFRRLFEKTEDYRILFLGLDAAGKTTMLYKMALGEVVTTIPTIGFNVESVKHKNTEFTVWDVGGRGKIRPLYRHYYQNTQGLVFVIDSNDTERFEEAMTELLDRTANEDELDGVPVLILANKQDLPKAMTPRSVGSYIVEKGYLRNHPWCVFGTSATSPGMGELFEGMEWLSSQVTRRRKQQLYDEHVGKSNKATESGAKKVNKTDVNNNANKGTDLKTPNKDKDAPKMSYLADLALSLKSLLKT